MLSVLCYNHPEIQMFFTNYLGLNTSVREFTTITSATEPSAREFTTINSATETSVAELTKFFAYKCVSPIIIHQFKTPKENGDPDCKC
jgi:hypothetical protein